MEVNTMMSLGSLLFIVAIGALIYFAMEKGGGHNEDKEQGTDEQPRGGCCG
jgi:hypothetical protein